LVTLQFPGAGGDYYLTPEQVEETVARLRAENPEFGSNGKGVDRQGRERDSFEIVWETHQGHFVRYPDSDLAGPVLLNRNESVADDHITGGDVTLMGRIDSNGLRVLRVTTAGPLSVQPARPTATEFWILEEGAIALDGRECRSLTVIQLRAGATGLRLDVIEPATFTVLRLPELTTN
jgi:hypothetical protein